MEKVKDDNRQIVDERVDLLFRDLKRLNEDLKKPSLPGPEELPTRQKQIDLPNINNTAILESARALCPFLKASWNPTVQYGFPNEENFCYKGKKPGPVSLEHQEQVCYSKQYARCQVAAPTPVRRRLLALLQNFF